MAFVAIGIAGVVMSIVLGRGGCFNDGGVAYNRFFTVPPSSITRIVLAPSGHPFTSPMAAPIVITNPAAINAALQTLRPPMEVKPDHPASIWRYEIEITDSAGSSHGVVESTTNQGVLLYIRGRLYTSSQLDQLLQSATAGSGN